MADEKKPTSKAGDQPAANTDQAQQAEQPTRFFVVNPAGAVHQVTKSHARELIKTVGWRLATNAEIEQYDGTKIQRFNKPIAKPFAEQLAELEGDDDEI